jgi:putative endonuclease
MADHNELGKQGEALAVKYLQKQGYEILETNWRAGRFEIDIIAGIGDFLVIVEVKARQSNVVVEPEFSVTRQKQKSLITAANIYIRWKNIIRETRFDIISIIINPEETSIKHITNAFYPTLR